MAAFVFTKYESDDGNVHPIKMSPEKAALAGTAPAGTITSSVKAKVTKGAREYGLKPRGIVLSRTFGTAPDTFTKSVFIPRLTDVALDDILVDDTATYDGLGGWRVTAKKAEDY